MFKPAELTTRQTAAAINRLNNALPMFPNGTNESKFSPTEVIGLLEWSLPPAWRAKFDLDGYVPTLGTKAKLIEACEAIERNKDTKAESNKTFEPNSKKSKIGKNKTSARHSGKKSSAGDEPKHYCTEHGHNPSHDTSDCWTLQNRAKKSTAGHEGVKKRSFSNKAFCKEINFLAKKLSKAKVLELYATVVKREQAKLAKKSSKKRKSAPDSDDKPAPGRSFAFSKRMHAQENRFRLLVILRERAEPEDLQALIWLSMNHPEVRHQLLAAKRNMSKRAWLWRMISRRNVSGWAMDNVPPRFTPAL